MPLSTLSRVLLGESPRMRRLVGYWVVAMALYLVSLGLLAHQVHVGEASAPAAAWLGGVIVVGSLVFYVVIRASERLAIPSATLTLAQTVFALATICAAYAVIGRSRGALLANLSAMVVFSAFALPPAQTRALVAAAIALLAATMGLMRWLDPLRHPLHDQVVHLSLAVAMLGAVGFLTGELTRLRERLKQQKADLADALARIEALATTDELTGLANRRHAQHVVETEWRRQMRAGRSGFVALLDVDHFKRINDTYGHSAGDAVLRALGAIGRERVRPTDLVARWGGEEFLVLLPQTAAADAMRAVERLRGHAAALRFDDIDPALRVTVSAGLAELCSDEPTHAAIERADRALYAAKAAGRDRCECA